MYIFIRFVRRIPFPAVKAFSYIFSYISLMLNFFFSCFIFSKDFFFVLFNNFFTCKYLYFFIDFSIFFLSVMVIFISLEFFLSVYFACVLLLCIYIIYGCVFKAIEHVKYRLLMKIFPLSISKKFLSIERRSKW